SQGIKFDPDNTNQYDLNRTDYGANSTVEYQAGLVQADEYGNLIVNGASNSSSGTITVNGNMTKQSSTSFSSAAEVIVNGNYTNTEGDVSYGSGLFLNGSTLTATSGNFINSVVTFTGTSGQTITGSPTATNFFALDISNPNGLTLNKPVNITQTLSLNNGLIITTATNILTLVGSASVSGGNDNSFVYGPLARTSATGSKDFPIGKSVYRPVNTNFSGSSPVVQFEVFDTAPIQNFDPPLELISQVRHWTGIILSGSVSSGSVTLNYGTDDGVQLGDSLRVAYSPDQNTTAYFSIGGSGSSAGSGSITGNLPINSPLGYFTLGSVSLDNSLPVELTTFSAVGKSGKILLSWETASEINNMGFDVVRSEKEAGSYTKINQQMIQGQGNSNTAHFYEFEDVNVAENQRYYYKLYSRDFDGTVHDYGEVVSATVKQLPKNFRLAQNYPNPFNPSTTISIEVAHKSTISLEIYNMLGQKIRTLIDGSRLQPGVYDNIVWDATDDQGNAIANGIYYLVFNAADYNFRQVRKMVFMK
ncbi:MAG: T9SS C-terminal target domain-containing protein, partial [Calditrichaeota bacterium]